MSSDTPSVETRREQAACWAVRLNEGELSATERNEFQDWLLADPSHAAEFRAQDSFLKLFGIMPAELTGKLLAYGAPELAAPQSAQEVESPPTLSSQTFRLSSTRHAIKPSFFSRFRPTQIAALAASVLFAVVGTAWYAADRTGLLADSYATDTGETRKVTFEDGSVAYLNTRTKLRWMGNAQDRRVVLLEGEALFEVVADATRPFRITVDDSEIRVLGTRFNVYRKSRGDVAVTVLEGSVEVRERADADKPAWLRRLKANQRIIYTPVGLIRDVHDTQALDAVQWRLGVLELEDEPLPSVLDELTRYTDRRIVIRDSRLAQLRVGGALSIRDVRAALARLEKLAPVAVTENGNVYTLDYQTDMMKE